MESSIVGLKVIRYVLALISRVSLSLKFDLRFTIWKVVIKGYTVDYPHSNYWILQATNPTLPLSSSTPPNNLIVTLKHNLLLHREEQEMSEPSGKPHSLCPLYWGKTLGPSPPALASLACHQESFLKVGCFITPIRTIRNCKLQTPPYPQTILSPGNLSGILKHSLLLHREDQVVSD